MSSTDTRQGADAPLGAALRPGLVAPAAAAVRHGPHIAAANLHKSYRKGPLTVPVLRGLSMSVQQGEFLAIVGQSGSGKSTLLHLLGTLDAPDRGEIHFEGERIDNLPSVGAAMPCGTASSA